MFKIKYKIEKEKKRENETTFKITFSFCCAVKVL